MYLIRIVNNNSILLSILLIIACNIILHIMKFVLIITFCLEKQENTDIQRTTTRILDT